MSAHASQRFGSLLLSVILTFVFLPESGAQAPSATPVRTVLGNGLTIIVNENHAAEIVTLQVWAKVGSRDEDEAHNGVAHFIEHMLFKGTPLRPVGHIDREVEALGGIQNASTSRDFTQFYIVAASRFFDRILEIQADALQHSTFDREELERERRVVLEEINRRDDTPASRTNDLLYAAAYSVHPYKRPVLGTREGIQQMSRDVLVDFYHTYYVPQNITVVVVGDVRSTDVLAKVRHAYGAWQGRAPARPPIPPEPSLTGVHRAVLEQDIRSAYMRIGWIGPGVSDHDIYAMDVLAYALGRGRASRLGRVVRERLRVAQEISAGFFTSLDPALFQVFAVVEPGSIAAAEDAIVAEIATVYDVGITDDELRRAKALIEGDDIIATHTSRGYATTLGFYATVADLPFALTYRDRIRQVTRDDVQRVARRYLDPHAYAIAIIRPRSP